MKATTKDWNELFWETMKGFEMTMSVLNNIELLMEDSEFKSVGEWKNEYTR